MRRVKSIFLSTYCFLLLASISFAQTTETTETIEIATYYPAPYGSYSDLQLFPKAADSASACNANSRGTMYYDDTNNQVLVCKDIGSDTYSWSVLGGWG